MSCDVSILSGMEGTGKSRWAMSAISQLRTPVHYIMTEMNPDMFKRFG